MAGFDPATKQGPASFALAIGEWAVPLVVLEAYLQLERASEATGRGVVANLLVVLAAMTGFGVYRAIIGMWLPLMLSP